MLAEAWVELYPGPARWRRERSSGPRVPEPLAAQLAPGGRLIIPIGDLSSQELVILERPADAPGKLVQREAGAVRFVPLISRLAFTEGM